MSEEAAPRGGAASAADAEGGETADAQGQRTFDVQIVARARGRSHHSLPRPTHPSTTTHEHL